MAGESNKTKSLREEYPKSVPLTGGPGPTFKWNKPGTTLRGKFLRLREGSMGGDMLMLDTPSGVVTASCPKTLSDALADVRQGTEVVIRYIGEQGTGKLNSDGSEIKYKQFDAVAL